MEMVETVETVKKIEMVKRKSKWPREIAKLVVEMAKMAERERESAREDGGDDQAGEDTGVASACALIESPGAPTAACTHTHTYRRSHFSDCAPPSLRISHEIHRGSCPRCHPKPSHSVPSRQGLQCMSEEEGRREQT